MVRQMGNAAIAAGAAVLLGSAAIAADALSATTPQVGPHQFPPPPQLTSTRELKVVRSNIEEAPDTLTVEEAEVPSEPTRILDRAAAERLFGNSGITLQWIGWEERGRVWIAVDETGNWWLSAMQKSDGNGELELEGRISEIGADYFIFDGEITIYGSPDADRFCDANKQWRFAITQNRKYWRLRELEWCDRLTDYIDIYF